MLENRTFLYFLDETMLWSVVARDFVRTLRVVEFAMTSVIRCNLDTVILGQTQT